MVACNPGICKKQEDCQESEASLSHRQIGNNKIFTCGSAWVHVCVQVHMPEHGHVWVLEVNLEGITSLLFETGSPTEAGAC